MAELQSEKYNIAWFKLAEFITRGEKERALGLFRLLAHSIQDPALTAQLKGDILLSFNDEQAIDEYLEAISIHKKYRRFAQAAALYEHILLVLDSNLSVNSSYKISKYNEALFNLVLVYLELNYTNKIAINSQKLTERLLEIGLSDLERYFEVYNISLNKKIELEKLIILNFYRKSRKNEPYIFHMLDFIIKHSDSKFSNKFLLDLKEINQEAYLYAEAKLN